MWYYFQTSDNDMVRNADTVMLNSASCKGKIQFLIIDISTHDKGESRAVTLIRLGCNQAYNLCMKPN